MEAAGVGGGATWVCSRLLGDNFLWNNPLRDHVPPKLRNDLQLEHSRFIWVHWTRVSIDMLALPQRIRAGACDYVSGETEVPYSNVLRPSRSGLRRHTAPRTE